MTITIELLFPGRGPRFSVLIRSDVLQGSQPRRLYPSRRYDLLGEQGTVPSGTSRCSLPS